MIKGWICILIIKCNSKNSVSNYKQSYLSSDSSLSERQSVTYKMAGGGGTEFIILRRLLLGFAVTRRRIKPGIPFDGLTKLLNNRAWKPKHVTTLNIHWPTLEGRAPISKVFCILSHYFQKAWKPYWDVIIEMCSLVRRIALIVT